jgi:hypothetical protein
VEGTDAAVESLVMLVHDDLQGILQLLMDVLKLFVLVC